MLKQLITVRLLKPGHWDDENQSEKQTKTIDSNIFKVDLFCTRQLVRWIWHVGIYCFTSAIWLVFIVWMAPISINALQDSVVELIFAYRDFLRTFIDFIICQIKIQ